MSSVLAKLTFGFCATFISASALANLSEQEARSEAQATCEVITATQKAYGKEKTLAKANNPNGDFQKQGMFVFAYDASGLTLAHPNPDLVGKTLVELNQNAAVLLRQEIANIGDNKEGNAWLNVSWGNNGKALGYTSYIERFEDVYWVCVVTQ